MVHQAYREDTNTNEHEPLPPLRARSTRGLTQSFLTWVMRHQYFFFMTMALLSILLVMVGIYKIGFGAMATKSDLIPERLRDFTFPVWQQYSFLRHGFLTFLSSTDFVEGRAYANHPIVYLLFMDMLYHLQLAHERLTMRISGAYLAMAASLLTIGFVGASQLRHKFEFKKSVLISLGLLYFLTLPTYWISLGKFNVDNKYIFILPILIMVAYGLSYGKMKGAGFWTFNAIFCAIAPIQAVLLGLFLLLRLFQSTVHNTKFALCAMAFILVGGAVYLEPVFIAKLLEFKSENSSWLFRSGLDGDVRYYSNFFNSVFFPQFVRPFYLLLVPIGALSVQLAYNTRPSNRLADKTEDEFLPIFLQILFCPYILTLLFWPQAISIHPYLFDHLLVGPIVVWIIINFSLSTKYTQHFTFWVLAMLFLVSFNLTEIAQAAHCQGCYFPTWDMTGPRAGAYRP